MDEHFDGALLANSERVDYFNAINSRNVKILKTKEYIRLLSLCMYFRGAIQSANCSIHIEWPHRPLGKEVSEITTQ